MRPSSWQCSDFNAGIIPIKKRKFLFRPPAEEVSSTLSDNSCQLNDQSGCGDAKSVPCSLDVNENMEKTLPEEKRGSCVTADVTDQTITDQITTTLSSGELRSLIQPKFIGNVGKIEKLGDVKSAHFSFNSSKEEMKLSDTENMVRGLVGQPKVKTEADLPVSSITFREVEKREQLVKLPDSNTVSSSVQPFSSAKLPNKEKLVEVESSGVVVSLGQNGMRIDLTGHSMHGIIEETCGRKNVGRECQAELSSGSGTAKLSLGCKTGNNIQYGEVEASLALNLSLNKGVCPPHNSDTTSVSTTAGESVGINRSNWDLNTTMDAWEDARGCASMGKANLAVLISKSSPRNAKALSSCDKTAIANPVSEEQEKMCVGFRFDIATRMQSDRQDNSRFSLSLGLNSHPPVENSPLSSRTAQTCSSNTSSSEPMITGSDVNPASLRIVKSEHSDEVVGQETGNAKICPAKLSHNSVKQEPVEKCSQETTLSSGFMKPVDPTSIKSEPNNCIQSEVINRKTGTLNQPNEMCDLSTCSTSNQKEKIIPCSTGYRVPVCLSGMTVNAGGLNYSEYVLHGNSGQSSSEAHGILHKTLKLTETDMISTCFGQGDSIRTVSGVTVALSAEDKTVDDRKTCSLKEIPFNSHRKDENSPSDEENINLSGDVQKEDFYGFDFESDGAHDISKVEKKQDGRINEDGKVQRSDVSVVSEDNSPAKKSKLEYAMCGGSETQNRDIAVVFGDGYQYSSYVDERGSESTVIGETADEHIKECSGTSLDTTLKKHADDDSCSMELVELPSSEEKIRRLIPELQRRALDESGEKEGQIIQDGEHLSCRVTHASKEVSGAFTVSSLNVQIPEVIDRSGTASIGAGFSTGDPLKEFSGGSFDNRIMNLAHVSDKNPAGPLDASGSFGPSRVERERLSDLPFESKKFLSQGRDDAFHDESFKFSRERYHGRFGNQRLNFTPDRRRFSDRTESNPRSRDLENFEFDNYGSTREDGAFVRSCRRGRRSWNDQATFFSRSFSRRRSPGNSEDAFAFHEHGDGEKFTRERGLPRNNTDHMVRPHHSYEYLDDGPFVQGQRDISTNHKRAFPPFRSRSPTRSRARSPGPCSSFSNRSPDGFAGHPDLTRRRSSPSYRMERIRSPDHSGFPRDMNFRRPGSPRYTSRPSNDLRDVGFGRGRGFSRSCTSYRNQPGRGFRNHGKFNTLDSRERVEYGDDTYEGPSHLDRFGVNVNVERRRFGDRHGGPRLFRPAFNTDDCRPTNIESDPHSTRFGQEDATDTMEERRNLREFDRQSKNFTENASGRTRNVEEKEDGEQVKKRACQ
ncbi:PREDICTED: uncharacterized protein LOC104809887 [Tarenaya hassleriana]|uniref:uncharacterized protein LOC104809887 n=1 Tax=Tarenaya hassleriana TaxID=28532 RepID=UPI00053C8132|nr:PREDICTED: uncharacterized protein LOC104809887 [Tarenaya hassleriana]XP_010534294.1 PREDICTED: uncharacterized protein LOC104809887 [Tarenaya hassleriana]